MQVNIVELKNCLDKAREMVEHYRMYVLNGGERQKSGDNLHELCETYLRKKITIFRLDESVRMRSIRGFFLKEKDDSFVVCLLHETDACWENFVLCKELFHVVLDDEKYQSIELPEHVEAAVTTFLNPISAKPPVELELLAEVAAMEFCFPYSERVRELERKPLDYLAISKRYNIPQSYVEGYLSDAMMKPLGVFPGVKPP